MKNPWPAMEPLEARIAPAVFTVTSAGDNGNNTLRAAIDSGDSTIVFKLPAHSTISLASALPTITDSVSIIGPGASKLTISGNGNAIFSIATGSTSAINTSISGLTLTNGFQGQGGAISLNDPGYADNLTVKNCVITHNSAVTGGGIFTASAGARRHPRLHHLE